MPNLLLQWHRGRTANSQFQRSLMFNGDIVLLFLRDAVSGGSFASAITQGAKNVTTKQETVKVPIAVILVHTSAQLIGTFDTIWCWSNVTKKMKATKQNNPNICASQNHAAGDASRLRTALLDKELNCKGDTD